MRYKENKLIIFSVLLITILSIGIQINICKNSYGKEKGRETTTYLIKLGICLPNSKQDDKTRIN
ncbi:hypothetical protein [Mariniflexile sp.]|uniref:hypothetical protein n=1 Tax=Mariniflexile sp. TaxID=1979402 RepID=UPI004047B332